MEMKFDNVGLKRSYFFLIGKRVEGNSRRLPHWFLLHTVW